MKKYRLLFLLLSFCFSTALPVAIMAQDSNLRNESIKMEMKNERLPQVFKRLEKIIGYKIMFTYDDINDFSVSGKITTRNIQEVMEYIIDKKPLEYRIDGQYIYVTLKENAKKQNSVAQEEYVNIEGHVVDKARIPLAGVNVSVIGTNRGYGTGIEGHFRFEFPKGKPVELRFSFIGMKPLSKKITCEQNIADMIIVMEEDDELLNEVVINGMFERRKESFTGATTTFNQKELMQVGNQNLLKSLKNLDPSFQIVENIEMGANPNSMPEIQMRGETSFNIQGDYDGNANQPLFILDGFEASLEKIWDLDMNRIQSVTLLKDAAAKAVYGSKAGNGVVVIETIRPKSGEMRISYTGDLNLEIPDLTGYNLMNAQEKFNWEIAHHKYDDWQSMNNPQAGDNLYKSVYDAIASGVDTYWLSKPLRTGIGQKHSLSLEGGDSHVRYILGLSYNDVAGVMKDSGRRTFNINSTLSYTYKNMVFRNQIDYTRNISKNSPYGSFSDYVSLEPYYAPYDSEGNLKKILGYSCANDYYPVYNPLYNATLNVKDESAYTAFQDNFDMDWHINDHFRFTAQMSYNRTENSSDLFYPSGHTIFIDYDDNGLSDRKGRYTKSNGYSETLSLQAGLSYNQTWKKHAVFLNGTWNLRTYKSANSSVVAEGFGNDSMGDISMANSYQHDSRPSGSDSQTREIGVVGALNYSYDDRYLFDTSYRATGSSVYGSDNHWGGFWSIGIGWNLHKEKFFSKATFISLLKLRYSLGYTGTQNFNPYQARAKYEYGDIYYDGRLGTTIMGIPNIALQWQKVYDNNFGIDFAIKNYFTMRVEYYIQKTDNMLTDITLPASTGFTSYKENMGEMENKGYEIALGITPWRNSNERAWLTFTATAQHNENKITKIYDIFRKSNDDADAAFEEEKPYTNSEVQMWRMKTTRPATKYYEGCSMNAIWGVRSLGIDPMSGNELFLDKNGELTYTWNSDDQVVIGNTTPDLRGALGVSAGWKGWTLNINTSYKFGGEMYNSTLIDRVENVNGFGNLDKRVADTWTQPGDHVTYRKIEMMQNPNDYNDTTRPTSRFVQKDNELYISSINIGYDFYNMKFVKLLGLERLYVSFYANELARFNSVKVERGLTYPFARTFSFSVNATF